MSELKEYFVKHYMIRLNLQRGVSFRYACPLIMEIISL